MSDSNQDIKNRLSEGVRDNAKHLLDPHRKVNGEPVPAQQPQLFTGGVMRWYQIEGIEWLRVSIMLSDSFLHCAKLLFCPIWHFKLLQRGKKNLKNLLKSFPSSWAFHISQWIFCSASCVLLDAVGKWYQWNSGWWDGTGKDHPVHRSHCHDDRKKSHGPLPGCGPLVYPPQLDQRIQAIYAWGQSTCFWTLLLYSDSHYSVTKLHCQALLCLSQVSVLCYHGPQAERAKLLKQIRRPQGPLTMCPVVVTSFEISMIDRKFLQVRFRLSKWDYTA